MHLSHDCVQPAQQVKAWAMWKMSFCQAQMHVHSQTGSANIGSSLQPLQAQVLKAFAGWKVQAVCRLQVSLSQHRGVYVYYSLCRLHEICMAFAGFGCPLQAHVHCLGKLMFSIAFTGSCQWPWQTHVEKLCCWSCTLHHVVDFFSSACNFCKQKQTKDMHDII